VQTQRRIAAAGAVVWRKSKRASGRTLSGFGQLELLLVHRPKYDDWTFPKGKADAGEELPATAVREVREETGAQVRLGVPLLELSYETSQGTKDVTYWSARVTGGVDATDYAANVEVDEVRWVGAPSVTDLLTYERDREVLEAFAQAHAGGAHKTRTLVIVRHAEAEGREDWSGDDEHRPLSRAGRERAGALVAMFAAYGVEHLVSSDTARCVSTIEPYAEKAATYIALDSRLAQKPAKEPPRSAVARAVDALLEHKPPVLACSNRPVLPSVFEALGLPDAELQTGELAVVHHRRGEVVAVEVHRAP